jgi:hypothetical protein
MLLLAFHIVATGMLAAAVGYVAYQAGYAKAEKRLKRRLAALGITPPEEEE